jgi:hypothetical protein
MVEARFGTAGSGKTSRQSQELLLRNFGIIEVTRVGESGYLPVSRAGL